MWVWHFMPPRVAHALVSPRRESIAVIPSCDGMDMVSEGQRSQQPIVLGGSFSRTTRASTLDHRLGREGRPCTTCAVGAPVLSARTLWVALAVVRAHDHHNILFWDTTTQAVPSLPWRRRCRSVEENVKSSWRSCDRSGRRPDFAKRTLPPVLLCRSRSFRRSKVASDVSMSWNCGSCVQQSRYRRSTLRGVSKNA